MSGIRNRIFQLGTYLASQFRFTQGGVLLGRKTGAGAGEEIEIGDGLDLVDGVLTATAPTADFATNKATIVDADKMAILDSAAAGAPKHALFSLVKSTLTTTFDALYDAIGSAAAAQAAAIAASDPVGSAAAAQAAAIAASDPVGSAAAVTVASIGAATAAQGALADSAVQDVAASLGYTPADVALLADVSDVPLSEVAVAINSGTTTISPFEVNTGTLNKNRVAVIQEGNVGRYTIVAPSIATLPPHGNPSGIVGPFWVHNRDNGFDYHIVFGVNLPANCTAYARYKTSGWVVSVFPSTSGTVALTSDITGTNSGTNTGDETGARIATLINAATPIATLADDDRIGGTDTSASGIIGYITGSVLWTWIAGKLDAGRTWAGIHAFSSTTRPTSAGTGALSSTSLPTRDDIVSFFSCGEAVKHLNFSTWGAHAANGGTSSAHWGGWQLYTDASANAIAKIYAIYYEITSDILSWDRRIIWSFDGYFGSRAGLQHYVQFGKPGADTTSAQISQKGFGVGMINGVATPFVHNGSSLTTGSTYDFTTYSKIMMDFVPGVALRVYGLSWLGAAPTLLSEITTGLPSGSVNWQYGQLEFVSFDTGSGGGAQFNRVASSNIAFC